MKKLLMGLALLAAGCIENTIPYPVAVLNIEAVEGEGVTVAEADIDRAERKVTVHLDEAVDPAHVRLSKITVSEGAAIDLEFPAEVDLTASKAVVVSQYDQQAEWTLVKDQPIAYRFTLSAQIGAAVIDPAARTVQVTVPKGANLGEVEVTELKLGPADVTVYSPAREQITNLKQPLKVTATVHGVATEWMVTAVQSEASVSFFVRTETIDLWRNRAEVEIVAPSSATTVELEYKRTFETDWIRVPATAQGGIYVAEIAPEWVATTNEDGKPARRLDSGKGVFAGYTYEYRVVLDGAAEPALTFDTDKGPVIPNGDMETWNEYNTGGTATAWFPCAVSEVGENKGVGATYLGFWGTGNAAMPDAGTGKLTTPADDPRPGSTGTKSMSGGSKKVVGTFAAGNLFTGYFSKVNGISGGDVAMGRPFVFAARPRAVSFWYKYTPGTGTGTNNTLTTEDKQDRARVWMCCGDFKGPHTVTSGASNSATFIDETAATLPGKPDEPIYGYMSWTSGDAQTEWKHVEMPIMWNDVPGQPVANYLIMAATASYRGDYMEGVVGSKIWVDDLEFIY